MMLKMLKGISSLKPYSCAVNDAFSLYQVHSMRIIRYNTESFKKKQINLYFYTNFLPEKQNPFFGGMRLRGICFGLGRWDGSGAFPYSL